MLAERVRAMKDIVLDLNQRNLYCYTGVVVTFTSPSMCESGGEYRGDE